MSIIPSLSVWSSVKFPFPKTFRERGTIKPYSVESCDNYISRNYEKNRAETAPEMVNLRVPYTLNVDKENSVPNLYCECSPFKKKPKKKNKHIRFVTIPEIIFYEKECAASTEKLSDNQITNFEDVSLPPCDKDEEIKTGGFEGRHGEIGSIPSVKPWTLEELVEINRQKEEAKKKMRIRRSKVKEKNFKNHVRALETSNGFFRPDENSTFVRNPTHHDCSTYFIEHYYECELHRLTAGLTFGSPEKSESKLQKPVHSLSNTDGRKCYQSKAPLRHHFEGLPVNHNVHKPFKVSGAGWESK